jgi:hypothetical protein
VPCGIAPFEEEDELHAAAKRYVTAESRRAIIERDLVFTSFGARSIGPDDADTPPG